MTAPRTHWIDRKKSHVMQKINKCHSLMVTIIIIQFIRWTCGNMAANPQTKPTNLGCRLLPSTVTPIVAIYCHYLAQRLIAWYPFTIPQRVESWVDLGGWLHTEMVYPPMDIGQSPIQPRVTTLIENKTLLLSHVNSERDYFWLVWYQKVVIAELDHIVMSVLLYVICQTQAVVNDRSYKDQ